MNKLVLSALLLGLFQSTACIIVTDDDKDGQISYLETAWEVTPYCPEGASSVVYAENTATKEQSQDAFDCSDKKGLTKGLPLGDYTVWVETTTRDFKTVYGKSAAQNISLTTDKEKVVLSPFTVGLPKGFFSLSWALQAPDTTPKTCAEIAATGVRVLATLATVNTAWDQTLACDGSSASVTTNPLLLGLYTVVVEVVDAQAKSLVTSKAIEKSLATDNQVVDLGAYTFKF